MTEQEHWQWQEPGRAWKGAGLYHVTLTVTDRQPVLGRLITPDSNPARARVVRTALGDALIDRLMSIPSHHPEVQVLHFCLMPDHLHAVLYVRRTMPKGIRAMVRGFWQAAKKPGRACSQSGASFIVPNDIREELKEGSRQLEGISAALCGQMGEEAYYRLEPLFMEMPFIRPMARYSQLQTTIRYVDMNPQRLATKRLKPGFFRVQKDIEIGTYRYDGVGNVALLMENAYSPVHVRHIWVEKSQHGDDQELREYKNACVLKSRNAVVMVSPFISPDEKQVMQVLLKERHPFILLTGNGFRDYYKPAEKLMKPHESHPRNRLMANVFYLAGFIEAWGRGYEKIREAFEKEKLEVPVFEEVRGGMMATIKREKFMAIQAKGGVIDNGKDVVDVVIDNVVEKLSERQLVIYKMIRKSVADGVVETASSIANKIKLSPRTIQRDLTRLKELNVIKHEGPDNGGEWVILKELNDYQ